MQTKQIHELGTKYLDHLPKLMKITFEHEDPEKYIRWRRLFASLIPQATNCLLVNPSNHIKCVEIDYFDDMSQPNLDLPDVQHGIDQGWASAKNTHLEDNLNHRDFTQRCVQYNSTNYVVFLKGKADLQPPQHMRAEWIADRLNTTYDIAAKFVAAFEALGMNRKAVLNYLFQHRINGEKFKDWRKANPDTEGKDVDFSDMIDNKLIDFAGIDSDLAEKADELEALAQAIKEPDWAHMNNYFQVSDDDRFDDSWIYLTDEVLEAGWISGVYDDETGELIADDELDSTAAANPFGAHPLQWGAESLSHEFIQMIKEADLSTLRKIQKGFFPSKSERTGKTYPPKYWYLSATQKAQAWVYLKERKAKIEHLMTDHPSEELQLAAHWIQQLGRSSEAVAIINRFKDGRSFDYYGETIEFKRKANPLEIGILWKIYKQLP